MTLRSVVAAGSAALFIFSVAACGSALVVADRPENPNAVPPVTIVAEANGQAAEYRISTYRTRDGMLCIEVASSDGASSACDPTGGSPIGSGVNGNVHGVVVWASTAKVSATAAIVENASGARAKVDLIDGGPTLPGIKIALGRFGPADSPVTIDFLDVGGARVDSVTLQSTADRLVRVP